MGWLRMEGLGYHERALGTRPSKDFAVRTYKDSEKQKQFQKIKEKYAALLQPIIDALENAIKSDFIEKTF